jgi:hypothetical protein
MLWRESATVEHAWRWLAKKNSAQIIWALEWDKNKATHLV